MKKGGLSIRFSIADLRLDVPEESYPQGTLALLAGPSVIADVAFDHADG